ncbi:MAG: TIGR04283 family arsenosugar biosynthesis glycosyltransferase [Cellvibrionaceae bacterium]
MNVAKAAKSIQPKVSVVIPTYNEAASIEQTLSPLQHLRRSGDIEIVVSDGGSADGTRELVAPMVDRCVNDSQGRAAQMNSGARVSSAELILFLHADTQLPDNFLSPLIKSSGEDENAQAWGFFPVRLSGKHHLFRLIEGCINLRSRLTSMATGDQALFVSRALWRELEGFADIALMEDVDFSRRARKLAKAKVQPSFVTTSSRRWEENGIVSTVVLMWRLRWLYFCGVSPRALAKLYR